MCVIQLKEIVKKYGDLTAIDHLDLTIEAGEIYGLLGPNGAGKTTLINIICDMVKKDSGQVLIFGEDLSKSTLHLKNNIGVVPQSISIYEDLTCLENVIFFGGLYGLKKNTLEAKARAALAFVGLDDKAKAKPKSFSGGMKRRLNIACAIVHEPELLIMDEPTVGIDPQSKHHILEAVRTLNQNGATIIYTTHLMEEAQTLCSRVGIIDHGRLIAEGTVEALQAIVSDQNSLMIKAQSGLVSQASLEALKGVVQVKLTQGVYTINILKESDCISDIVAVFGQHEDRILDIKMGGVSLETAFLSLTGRRLRD